MKLIEHYVQVIKDITDTFPKWWKLNENQLQSMYLRCGGFIDNVDKFDPQVFNITPKEAVLMDPQERVFLETAWHAFEDAGYSRSQLENYKVGVFVGAMYGHYQLYGMEGLRSEEPEIPNSSFASISNRVSYCFNLNGSYFFAAGNTEPDL